MIKGAIFDVDGTLLDSMPIWKDASRIYLETFGVTETPEAFTKMKHMSLHEGAEFMRTYYPLSVTKDQIVQGLTDVVSDFYANEVQLKPGVKNFLEELSRRHIPMTVATSSDLIYLRKGFKRLGIYSYFQNYYSSNDYHTTKSKPDIYYIASENFHAKPHEIAAFEDVLHAVTTLKNAGFISVAVYDDASADDQEQILRTCSVYAGDLTDFDRIWEEMNLASEQ